MSRASRLPLRADDRTPLWLYAVCLGLPVLAILAVVFGLGANPKKVLFDAVNYLNEEFHLAFFSNIGALGWWTAAVACALAALVLRPDRTGRRAAVAYGGALSAAMGLDDLLLVHDAIAPQVLGIPEDVAVAALGAALLAYLWRHRAFHRAMSTGLLVAAVALFGASAAVDAGRLDDHALAVIAEDATKLAGICAWAAYHALAAFRVLRDQDAAARAGGRASAAAPARLPA